MSKPRIVILDIETAPMIVHSWGLFNQNIGINQVLKPGRVIAFAAKEFGSKKVEFRSEFHDGKDVMIQRAWEILDSADIVVHYNGTTFDLPHLRREFLLAGMTPPSPVQEIDLLKTVKKVFRFDSRKLQYVSKAVGLEGKLAHEGHGLWVACLAGDEKAWSKMRRYNIQDVRLTEDLYEVLRPWIPNHPHLGVFFEDGLDHCPNCGSTELVKRGFKYTPTATYQQYVCKPCGKWNRGTRSVALQKVRGVE